MTISRHTLLFPSSTIYFLWCGPIDQTSVRTQGNVVIFGLTKLYTKEYIHTVFTTTTLLSHRLDIGGGVIERGGGNQLIMSNTYNTTNFWSEIQWRHSTCRSKRCYLFSGVDLGRKENNWKPVQEIDVECRGALNQQIWYGNGFEHSVEPAGIQIEGERRMEREIVRRKKEVKQKKVKRMLWPTPHSSHPTRETR